MKYSLRSLMIAAFFAPAVLAGIYLAITFAWNWQPSPPTFEPPAAGNPNVRELHITDELYHAEDVTLFVNSSRSLRFPSKISTVESDQHKVQVTPLSSTAIKITGTEMGAAEIGILFENGHRITIPVTIAKK